MEHIITFLPEQFTNSDLWGVQMAGITYPDKYYRVRRDCSEILCLEYILAGQGELEVDGVRYHPRAGDVYLLPVGKDHHYHSDGKDPWEKIWMNVYGSLASRLVESYGLAEQFLFPNCPLFPLFREFLTLCETHGHEKEVLSEKSMLLFHQIMLRLAASIQSYPTAREDPAHRVKDYIDQHIYDKLSVSTLAQRANLSASQLTRLFKKNYQVTPYEYILARKIDTACLLLDNTVLSVKEIAYRLNFADEHYFSNIFRQRTGEAPGTRRKARNA